MTPLSTVGIVGTAKNTGKTTTLTYLLNNISSAKIGLTGIGYDGEEVDNITLLPKPRLFLQKGILAATAEQCIRTSTAKVDIISGTGLFTPLGEILVCKIVKEGFLIIAGPTSSSSLKKIITILGKESGIILIDGSLNRLAPLAVVDNIIFTTGASKSLDVNVLTEEMKLIESVFSYNILPHNFNSSNVILRNNNDEFNFPISSILLKEEAELISRTIIEDENIIFIPGIISAEALNIFNACSKGSKNINLILTSPVHLLLAGDYTEIEKILSAENLTISYSKKIKLKGITVNPFYPDFNGETYTGSFIDKNLLLETMKNNLRTPVYDIVTFPENVTELITGLSSA
jgi:hypothetical protein